MESLRTDHDLVAACLQGGRSGQAAWNELIERYGRLVYSIPRRYGLAEADSDDVFANVWAAGFRNLGHLRDQSRLSSWLITTTHRECWRIARERNRTVNTEEDFRDVHSPSNDRVIAWERQHIVWRALEAVGTPCKDLLTALFFESSEPNYELIASRLGMKVGSIGPTRARCFAKLEKILVRLGLDGSEG